MHKYSTLNDLILYYFNETEMAESVLTQKDIDCNPETEDQYQEIVKTMDYIDNHMISPSSKTISNILNFSRKTAKVI
jgi:hypothetical protein